jgi:hypothetical protein
MLSIMSHSYVNLLNASSYHINVMRISKCSIITSLNAKSKSSNKVSHSQCLVGMFYVLNMHGQNAFKVSSNATEFEIYNYMKD